ncbi:MAG: complex I subunit 5 family protein [Haloferacaceae archaeon]
MSVSHVVIAPLLVALSTAILTLLTRTRGRLQRAVSLLGGVGYALAVAALVRATVLPLGSPSRTLVYQVSAWRPPFGIVLVADALSAFVLVISAVVGLAALAYSVLYVGEYGQRLSYHPLFHFMWVGVTGAFLTGDVFNLFVWFEVMLMSSYVLVAFYGNALQTRATLRYVVINLAGSAVMLLAIGGIYATTGTLNMADIARRLATPEQFGVDPVPVLGLSALLFAVFAIKAGVVPFQFWVPDAYQAAPAPVTAVLAGVVKKVGIYAIVRLYFTVFAAASLPALGLPGFSGSGEATFLAFFGPIMFVMAAGSAIFGGLGAVSRTDLESLLAYSSIGQVGFIVLPLAIAATVPDLRVLGVAAALVYSLNHGLAKGMLFLVAGTVKDAVGSTRFADLGGVGPRAPTLSACFLLGGLSLIGVPPLLGFFGKLLVFRVVARAFALGTASSLLAVGVALAGAILTIAYVSRAWNAVFWGPPGERVRVALPRRWIVPGEPATDGGEADAESAPAGASVTALRGQLLIVAALTLVILGVGVGFDPVYRFAEAAAHAALDTQAYVHAVGPSTFDAAHTAANGGGH